MDVAFIIDNTESMEDALDALKAGIADILDYIRDASRSPPSSPPDYRLALVTPDNDIVNVRVPFTQNNRTSFLNALNDPLLGDYTGQTTPESTDECLNTVVNGLWECHREGQATECPAMAEVQMGDFFPPFGEDEQGNSREAHRIVVLITDAVPGGFCTSYNSGVQANAQKYAQMARCNGIRIAAIQVESLADPPGWIIPEMTNYADTTCGWYVRLPWEGTGIDEAILDILFEYSPEDPPVCSTPSPNCQQFDPVLPCDP